MISFQELATFSSIRSWTLTGESAVVKAVSIEDATRPAAMGSAKGYVTQAKFLIGLNSLQIESALGLRPNSLKKGAYIFYFARLPKPDEVDQRFTADLPDGRVWTDELHDRHKVAREATKVSGTDVVDFYPPGSSKVMQWTLLKPVPLSGFWRLVTSSVPFSV